MYFSIGNIHIGNEQERNILQTTGGEANIVIRSW